MAKLTFDCVAWSKTFPEVWWVNKRPPGWPDSEPAQCIRQAPSAIVSPSLDQITFRPALTAGKASAHPGRLCDCDAERVCRCRRGVVVFASWFAHGVPVCPFGTAAELGDCTGFHFYDIAHF